MLNADVETNDKKVHVVETAGVPNHNQVKNHWCDTFCRNIKLRERSSPVAVDCYRRCFVQEGSANEGCCADGFRCFVCLASCFSVCEGKR